MKWHGALSIVCFSSIQNMSITHPFQPPQRFDYSPDLPPTSRRGSEIRVAQVGGKLVGSGDPSMPGHKLFT
jgi:hypothetical protein